MSELVKLHDVTEKCITHWRANLEAACRADGVDVDEAYEDVLDNLPIGVVMALCYIDAYQSIRVNMGLQTLGKETIQENDDARKP